ncbi:predicted protein [Thalassiosira pseudonana CCMP1335]|uniref:Uncharacterized protein n=1 Tax=Thalassiosira pseudonana TaxID=35128 RepID=B8C8P3_THAPS|nr:predicted protein [Thalassiosira pseudonana CCMP1335]EED90519.1 predicted protein [Thalassiosira pseudonana CCMP1335]|eukprot:scaffold3337_cov204-Alexandrium_tamarense.AAC.22
MGNSPSVNNHPQKQGDGNDNDNGPPLQRKLSSSIDRERSGRCPTCGEQTHRVEITTTTSADGEGVGRVVSKVKIPLTIDGMVYRGRCLICLPLPGGGGGSCGGRGKGPASALGEDRRESSSSSSVASSSIDRKISSLGSSSLAVASVPAPAPVASSSVSMGGLDLLACASVEDSSERDVASLAPVESKAAASSAPVASYSAHSRGKKLQKLVAPSSLRSSAAVNDAPAADATASTEGEEWNCTTCSHVNLPHKKRCGKCQGWRGGFRENIRNTPRKREGSSQQTPSSTKSDNEESRRSRNRVAPQRFVARPSKQGLGVDQGDAIVIAAANRLDAANVSTTDASGGGSGSEKKGAGENNSALVVNSDVTSSSSTGMDTTTNESNNDAVLLEAPVWLDESLLMAGTRVIVSYKGAPFKATVRKRRIMKEHHQVLLHYDGNKKSNVHWVPLDRITDILYEGMEEDEYDEEMVTVYAGIKRTTSSGSNGLKRTNSTGSGNRYSRRASNDSHRSAETSVGRLDSFALSFEHDNNIIDDAANSAVVDVGGIMGGVAEPGGKVVSNGVSKRKRSHDSFREEPASKSLKSGSTNKRVFNKNDGSDDEAATRIVKRKSNISPRPRELRPTSKLLAMQATIASSSKRSTSVDSKKAAKKHGTKSKAAEEGDWKCGKCGNEVLAVKKRCGNCQSWKGGARENIRKSVTPSKPKRMPYSRENASHETPVGSWHCEKCGVDNLASKKRCGVCQGWVGGIRMNIRTKSASPKRKKKASSSSVDISNDKVKAPKEKVEVARQSKSRDAVEEDSDDEVNVDDVACCLCKCAVDFSDDFFFMPENTASNARSDAITAVKCESPPAGFSVPDARAVQSGDGEAGSAVEEVALNGEAKTGNPFIAHASMKTIICNGEGITSNNSEAYVDESIKADGRKELQPPTTSDGSSSSLVESSEVERKPAAKPEVNSEEKSAIGSIDEDDESEKSEVPPFQLPRRLYDPGNSLILCDGPAHATRRKSSGGQYKCNRAYHQLCHFIPVFSVPRGAWRCLVCRYRDEKFLEQNNKGRSNEDSLSDEELTAIFRCVAAKSPEEATSAVDANEEPTDQIDIASVEQRFEYMSAPLKAKILHSELTTRAKSLINTSLSTIRTAEHSIRAFTETNKARKALTERMESSLGLPQELIQCFMRIAQSKMRVRELIFGVEKAIKNRQLHGNLTSAQEGDNGAEWIDIVSELKQWYLTQQPNDTNKTLFHLLFPEKGGLTRRRLEPRTDESKEEAESASNSSGISLDNLRCVCCFKGTASNENDLLLCDGMGCYRAFHMCCVEPKLTLEDVEDEDESWFCPLCTAHATLVHHAQKESLGDEFHINPPPEEWEVATDVFPEAELEVRVAQKLKDGELDDECNDFLTETLGIVCAFSRQAAQFEYSDAADEEEDDDFQFGGKGSSDDSDSFDGDSDEEKQLMCEAIGKDELDALSACSSANNSDSSGTGKKRQRRSRRKRSSMPGDTSDDEQSKSGDIGQLDTSNILFGKRRTTKVDYRKLNDAMFGDVSDDEATAATSKFDYKPSARVQSDSGNNSSDSSSKGSEDESGFNNKKGDLKPIVKAPGRTKEAKKKRARDSGDEKQPAKKKAKTPDEPAGETWKCDNCGNNNLAGKKRCSVASCQRWKGGKRMNIRTKK